jgi:hypothetical protein
MKRALFVWFVIIAVEFVHGALRAIFLVPLVGDFRARQIGVFSGSIFILIVAWLFIRWLDAPNTKSLLHVGFLWLVLTLGFEFSFGHFVFHRSWQDLASDYDVRQGGLLLIGMAVLMFSPVIAARLRRR